MTQETTSGGIKIPVPLPDYVRQVALEAGREGAAVVMTEHLKCCPARALIEGTPDKPALEDRVKLLEHCKDDVVGAMGWLAKNWQAVLVILAVSISFFKSGGKVTTKDIQDAIRQMQTLTAPQTVGAVGGTGETKVSVNN